MRVEQIHTFRTVFAILSHQFDGRRRLHTDTTRFVALCGLFERTPYLRSLPSYRTTLVGEISGIVSSLVDIVRALEHGEDGSFKRRHEACFGTRTSLAEVASLQHDFDELKFASPVAAKC